MTFAPSRHSVAWKSPRSREKESIDMADNKQHNKDAQSGEPVQLDKEKDQQHRDGEQHQQGGQQQAGQPRPQHGSQQQGNQAGGQQQGAEHQGGQRK
jgi:hypothetical protein